MNIMDRILGRGKKDNHEEIVKKTQAVILGTDSNSQKVHESKNRLTKELLKISSQAKKVQKEAEKLNKIVDTAYLIAKSQQTLIVKNT